ncbi:MAG: NADH-quinone oxidoreductase subunit C [Candidatus Caenarcaniphilales bacterium]|jgi:NADH-quinone oxidoreductase subunit C|nr:NADH-quinone oxidoreductase subunit C [Candidatus Caenarcaniphilales bacterium]
MTETNIEAGAFGSYLKEKSIKSKALGKNASGTEMIELEPGDLIAAVKELKRSKKMTFLNYMTALEVKDAYQSVIQIENHEDNSFLVMKVNTNKSNPSIPTLCDIYPNANWFEREAYDMIGIKYDGHPNLTRILNPDKWEGYPLRKDYIGPIDKLNEPIKLSLQK